MNAKAKHSSISNKARLVLFSILAIVIVLIVILSNSKSVRTIEVMDGPTEPPNMQGPTGPPPA